MGTYSLKPYMLILVLAFSFVSQAQINIPKALQRYQAGYSFPMTTATYTEHNQIFNDELQDYIDTSFSKKIKTKGGFGVSMGTYIPIAAMSSKSCLAISVDFLYNMLIWDAETVAYDGYDSYTGTYSYNTNYVITAATGHMALPIGIDFKSGCDAILDKSSRTCISLGTGIYPSFNMTVYEANAGAKFKLQPYLKAEVGVFAGICWKVRALYSFGKVNYIDAHNGFSSNLYADESNVTLSGKSSLTISLLLMPFSFGWERSQWW